MEKYCPRPIFFWKGSHVESPDRRALQELQKRRGSNCTCQSARFRFRLFRTCNESTLHLTYWISSLLRMTSCQGQLPTVTFLKGKSSPVQNYHNFKRKSKNFPTDWCKNDENRIRNKEVVTFWNFTFFRKTFLDQSLWIFKWVSWWCHRLTICHIYYTWNFENFHFFPDTGKSISLYQNISE